MDYGTYKNNLSVVLTQACTDTDTVLHIDNAGAIPVLNEHGLYLTFVDTNEIVEVTSVDTTNNTITVVRGLTSFGGSSASSHNSGTKLSARVIAEHFDNLENNIENNEAIINSHVNNTSNPHNVTPSQIGAISKVEDDINPKLGGDLDKNGHKIIDIDNADISASAAIAESKLDIDYTDKEKLFNLLYGASGLLICDFQTYDMWLTLTNGGGTVSQNFGNCSVRTSAISQSYANIYLNSATRLYENAKLDMRVDLRYVGTNTLAFFGAIKNTHLVDQENHALTTEHAGVFIDDGVIYTSTSDGTTQEVQNVGTTLDFQDWRIIFGSSDIKFYKGSTLMATHSTNIPSNLFGVIQLYINNKSGTTDGFMYCWKIIKVADS